jgi:hypothetical protein
VLRSRHRLQRLQPAWPTACISATLAASKLAATVLDAEAAEAAAVSALATETAAFAALAAVAAFIAASVRSADWRVATRLHRSGVGAHSRH